MLLLLEDFRKIPEHRRLSKKIELMDVIKFSSRALHTSIVFLWFIDTELSWGQIPFFRFQSNIIKSVDTTLSEKPRVQNRLILSFEHIGCGRI